MTARPRPAWLPEPVTRPRMHNPPPLPPPDDLTRLTDADLARHCRRMAERWNDGSSDHAYRLLFEAADRLEGRND